MLMPHPVFRRSFQVRLADHFTVHYVMAGVYAGPFSQCFDEAVDGDLNSPVPVACTPTWNPFSWEATIISLSAASSDHPAGQELG